MGKNGDRRKSKVGMNVKVKRALVLILLCVTVFVMFSGFSLELTGTLKHNGKGSALLTFESELPKEEFEQTLQEKITGFNNVSAANTQTGGSDMLVVKSIEELENGYRVEIAFHRIDKLNISGRFEHKSLSEYLKNYLTNPDPENIDPTEEEAIAYRSQTLVKWNRGDLTGITVDALDKLILFKDKADNDLRAIPQAVSGEEVEIDDFILAGKEAKSNTKILTFYLLGLDHVTSVQMTFPGKITYCAGENMTIVDESTVIMTPSFKTALVKGVDESSATGYQKVGCLVGFVVYEASMSPTKIAVISIAGLLIVCLIVFLIVYLTGRGKKVIARDVKVSGSALTVGVRDVFHSETWKNVIKHKALYLFVLPAVILLLLFNYAPMFGLAVAFQDYNITDGVFGSEFIGLSMFKRILTSYDANYLAFRNTIFIALIRILTNFPIILIATLFVNDIRSKKVKTLVTTVSYIPYFISWVVIGGMTHSLFAVDGLLNKLLLSLGMETVNWYAEPDCWWPILTITSLWKGLGWSALIYISSLCLINNELYEACKIDGGGKIRQALTVTIPGIMDVIVMQIILDVGTIMCDNYDQIRALTKGSEAINKAVLIVGAREFDTVLGGRYTEGAVYGLVRGVVGLALVLLTNKLAKSADKEGIL